MIQWWSEAKHERLGENNTVGGGDSKKVKDKSCGRNCSCDMCRILTQREEYPHTHQYDEEPSPNP